MSANIYPNYPIINRQYINSCNLIINKLFLFELANNINEYYKFTKLF